MGKRSKTFIFGFVFCTYILSVSSVGVRLKLTIVKTLPKFDPWRKYRGKTKRRTLYLRSLLLLRLLLLRLLLLRLLLLRLFDRLLDLVLSLLLLLSLLLVLLLLRLLRLLPLLLDLLRRLLRDLDLDLDLDLFLASDLSFFMSSSSLLSFKLDSAEF